MAAWRTVLGRLTVGLAGLAMAMLGLYGWMWALIATSAFHAPNADPALDGDPCCPYPDTWGDVVLGAVVFVAIAAAATGLIVLGAMLVRRAVRRRRP